MILVGEVSCYWREKREINLSSSTSSTASSSTGQIAAVVDDESTDEEEAIDGEKTAFLKSNEKQQ